MRDPREALLLNLFRAMDNHTRAELLAEISERYDRLEDEQHEIWARAGSRLRRTPEHLNTAF